MLFAETIQRLFVHRINLQLCRIVLAVDYRPFQKVSKCRPRVSDLPLVARDTGSRTRATRERFNSPGPTSPTARVQRFVRRVSVARSAGPTLPADVVHRQAWRQNRHRIDQTFRAAFGGFRQ